jgi:uncharacterized YccA/Bax inhibitor family protein
MPLVNSSGSFGILFSLFVVVVAALNLVLDFDFIEQGVSRGAPGGHSLTLEAPAPWTGQQRRGMV